MVRRLSGPVPLAEGQLVFDFYKPEVGRLIKKRKEKIKQRNRRKLGKQLLSWMDTTVCDIPEEIIVQLDELMRQRRMEIQSKWTPEDEAERRGIDVKNLNRLASHDNRYFESGVGVMSSLEMEDEDE